MNNFAYIHYLIKLDEVTDTNKDCNLKSYIEFCGGISAAKVFR